MRISFALFTICFALFCLPLHAADKAAKSKEALSQIHERIESLKKQLSSSQEAHADAADALKESEKAISDANRKLFELSEQKQAKQQELDNLEKQKANLEGSLQDQQNLLAKQVYQQYLYGQQSYLQLMLQLQSPNAMARQLQYFSYITKARSKLIKSVQSNISQVLELNIEAEQALNDITKLKIEQENQRIELQNQKKERASLLKNLAVQIGAQRGEIDRLKRDENSLSALVERLSRVVPPKPSKPQKPAQAITNTEPPAQASQEPIAKNQTLPTETAVSGNFEALRGKLNLPVRGDVTNRFGAPRDDNGVAWKGLFIKASEGSEVKSIASGRVVFADWMRGFGNLLIIDHGDGYMSLYGNNQALLRKVGDNVKGGDTVAAVGNSGGNNTPGLYYELRKLSKPFDPMSWSVAK